MRKCLAIVTWSLLAAVAVSGSLSAEEKETPKVLNFKMKSLTGKPVDLKEYQGKVVLMVNVASRCGATPQYAGLQEIYDKYKDQGLVVLGFPCNQFGAQEPGTADEIQNFCEKNYGVTFPMFEKINVNGDDAAPLYKLLTSPETNPEHAGKIRWNFEKFLIGRDGKIVQRFATGVQPDDAKFVEAIEKQLAGK